MPRALTPKGSAFLAGGNAPGKPTPHDPDPEGVDVPPKHPQPHTTPQRRTNSPMTSPPQPPSPRWLHARTIINHHDPMNLIAAGCPEDEYDPELPAILQSLDQATDIEDLSARIEHVFISMFGGPDSVHFSNWQGLAEDLSPDLPPLPRRESSEH